ncbi:DUF3050 domain-containing protein [Flavobacteriaceae bacterium]|jgi:hypothetical protein|nr:DUF3050 domain-containing protein [Flavobacteriaceae bacterium]MDA7724292.1 DUF3050 domain-containing protein [Flavobacteriaceae bacterium]MDG1309504.1 DUF3050 domain-containing protein [Flavobacteriaceae bacterium]
MSRLKAIELQLEPLRDQLKSHALYSTLSNMDDVAVFMEKHVFAVWDFMSLLKSLQNHLTNVNVPWTPKGHGATARFINEIVMAEESDVNELGVPMSHYEMYLDAMNQVNANTSPIGLFVNAIENGDSIETAAKEINLETPVLEFIQFTMEVINSNKPHCIASAFTFGREDVIPDMFLEIVSQSQTQDNDKTYGKLLYYLNRHIELDGDEHGPISLKMVAELCGEDTTKWEEVLETAKDALKFRLKLWDHITEAIVQLNIKEVQTT